MMERKVMEFETLAHKQSRFSANKERVLYTLRGYTGYKHERKSDTVSAYSMLSKLGICAAACALVLAVNSRQEAEYDTWNSEKTENMQTETPVEDMGKLRFVELPSLISVFSHKANQSIPLTYSEYALLEDRALLSLRTNAAQNVTAMEDCIVKSVGEDEEKGRYVTLRTDADREWTICGFQKISVEKGQSLYAEDTIGTVKNGETVYISLLLEGRPQDMQAVFELDDAL